MIPGIVQVDCSKISGWDSFHEVFADQFGFPNFYGRNMDAWIDCLTSLDTPEDGMTTVHCAKGCVVTLQLDNVKNFRESCPDQYAAVIECAAFVNWRRIEVGEQPVLVLSFHE